ncbi:MAG: Crp/Fnr family transcriptional regulator [Bacteroidota bacterium]
MKEQLDLFIRHNLKNPKEEEISDILEIFQLKHFQKGDYFKQEDRICQKLGFILEGSMQHCVIKQNGEEVTLRVSKKNAFVTELLSMRTKEKTPIAIKVLEPTTVLVASEEDISRLTEINLTLNRLLREFMADSVEKQAKLYLLFLTGTAQERYRFIIESNPELLKKFPLRFIANMIGITPTQLSRIRNKKQH